MSKTLKHKCVAGELEYWLTLKGKKLNKEKDPSLKSQSVFCKEVAKIIGEYTSINVAMDINKIDILVTTNQHQLDLINVAYRNTRAITMIAPMPHYPNILQISFKLD